MTRIVTGANGRNRTVDLLITNELLYQLSYTGLVKNYIRAYDVLSWARSRHLCAGVLLIFAIVPRAPHEVRAYEKHIPEKNGSQLAPEALVVFSLLSLNK